tara:strand:- start:2308 stop:3111 length:804 start_codon:yes stop_codon:yes gene_type:complete
MAVTCHVLLISLQVNTASGVRVFEGVAFGLFAEVQRLVSGSVEQLSELWAGYVGLVEVQAENDALRREVSELQLEVQQERALAQRARGLEELLDMRREVNFSTVGARVIAGDATPYFRTVTIDRGISDGVRHDSAVVSPKGVVGRVVRDPGPRAARVQLLIDRNAAAGALVERNRVAGLVAGEEDGTLSMEYVSNLDDVQVGDAVITSGIDGIYPKGFVIGTVALVEHGSGLYKTIEVEPAVEFADLEDVLVIVREPTPVGAAAGGG